MKAFGLALLCLATASVASAAAVTYTQSSSTSWPTTGTTAFQTAVFADSNGARFRWRASTGDDDNDIGALFRAGASGVVQSISVHAANTGSAVVINDNSKPLVVDFFSATVTGEDVNGKPIVTYTSMGWTTATLTSGPYSGDVDPGFLKFDLADKNWNLSSGQWYAFLIGMGEEVTNDYFRVDAWANGGIANAYEIRRETNFGASRPFGTTTGINAFGTNGTLAGTGTRDIAFQVVVPEPAMLSLVGLVGMGLLRRRHV